MKIFSSNVGRIKGWIIPCSNVIPLRYTLSPRVGNYKFDLKVDRNKPVISGFGINIINLLRN